MTRQPKQTVSDPTPTGPATGWSAARRAEVRSFLTATFGDGFLRGAALDCLPGPGHQNGRRRQAE